MLGFIVNGKSRDEIKPGYRGNLILFYITNTVTYFEGFRSIFFTDFLKNSLAAHSIPVQFLVLLLGHWLTMYICLPARF